jgi:hypothetical protein
LDSESEPHFSDQKQRVFYIFRSPNLSGPIQAFRGILAVLIGRHTQLKNQLTDALFVA